MQLKIFVHGRYCPVALNLTYHAWPLVDMTPGADRMRHLMPEERREDLLISIIGDLCIMNDTILVPIFRMCDSPEVDAGANDITVLPSRSDPFGFSSTISGGATLENRPPVDHAIIVVFQDENEILYLILTCIFTDDDKLRLLIPFPQPVLGITLLRVPHDKIHSTIH